MRRAQEWFDLYGESHQNPTNEIIHWICVPSIFFTVLGLFYVIPAGLLESSLNFIPAQWARWDLVVVFLGLLFYLRLSFSLFAGFLIYTVVNMWFIRWLDAAVDFSFGWLMIIIFAVAWIGQFIGHKIEGKKPSFFQDVQFLLIGPAWLMSKIYRRIGLGY